MAGRKKPEREGAVIHVRKHPYRGDGVKDHSDRDRCEDCGLHDDHAVHQLEPVDPAAVELGHRITGERGSE